MEDKEIIIDGVDVAGCEYMLNNKIKGKQHCPAKAMPYAKETSCICRKSIDTPYNFCKHNPNCHYKQLKRLEEENARLKNERTADLVKQIDELKAENERLKAQLDVLEEDNKKLSSENDALYNNSLQEVKEDLVKRVWNLQTENKELAHYLACMTEQRNKANTILQKIKDIVSKIIDGYIRPYGDYNQLKQILELITKVEEE